MVTLINGFLLKKKYSPIEVKDNGDWTHIVGSEGKKKNLFIQNLIFEIFKYTYLRTKFTTI